MPEKTLTMAPNITSYLAVSLSDGFPAHSYTLKLMVV